MSERTQAIDLHSGAVGDFRAVSIKLFGDSGRAALALSSTLPLIGPRGTITFILSDSHK